MHKKQNFVSCQSIHLINKAFPERIHDHLHTPIPWVTKRPCPPPPRGRGARGGECEPPASPPSFSYPESLPLFEMERFKMEEVEYPPQRGVQKLACLVFQITKTSLVVPNKEAQGERGEGEGEGEKKCVLLPIIFRLYTPKSAQNKKHGYFTSRCVVAKGSLFQIVLQTPFRWRDGQKCLVATAASVSLDSPSLFGIATNSWYNLQIFARPGSPRGTSFSVQLLTTQVIGGRDVEITDSVLGVLPSLPACDGIPKNPREAKARMALWRKQEEEEKKKAKQRLLLQQQQQQQSSTKKRNATRKSKETKTKKRKRIAEGGEIEEGEEEEEEQKQEQEQEDEEEETWRWQSCDFGQFLLGKGEAAAGNTYTPLQKKKQKLEPSPSPPPPPPKQLLFPSPPPPPLFFQHAFPFQVPTAPQPLIIKKEEEEEGAAQTQHEACYPPPPFILYPLFHFSPFLPMPPPLPSDLVLFNQCENNKTNTTTSTSTPTLTTTLPLPPPPTAPQLVQAQDVEFGSSFFSSFFSPFPCFAAF